MTGGSRPDWATGSVVEARDVAAGVRRITVQRPLSAPAAPGAHIDVRLPLSSGEVTRSYSVVESERRGALVTISVLRVPRSRGGSAYLHGLAVGDPLVTTRPLQSFPLRLGAPRYVLLAGGIGITALLPMADMLRRAGADYSVVYAGRSRDCMAYLDRLEAQHGDRLEVRVSGERGRLDAAQVVAALAGGRDRDQAELYACGPHPLLDDVRSAWLGAGLPAANLRFETFGAGPSGPPFVVRVTASGVETTVGPDETLLDALVRSGVPMMFDCLKGECGLCVRVVAEVEGDAEHRDVFLSPSEQASGRSICTCVSRVVPRPGAERAVLTLT